ncbi:MAG: phosphate transport system protein [Saprospiraceae bacterium]|jgi:phosphate transport system protein
MITNQELALTNLREDITDLMHMVLRQLEKAKEALETVDIDLASEIITIEKKVNATELKIDKDCENILALYNPVAIDLRLVLASINLNTQLERIGDHADGIAEYIVNEAINEPFEKELLEDIQFHLMFETAISMVDDAIYSFIKEDTKIARWVFGKDITLNKINRKTSSIIAEYSRKNPERIKKYLYLFSIMKKLERVGDLSKNIAEETVYFVDAKYIKHKDKKFKDNTTKK